MKSNAGIQLTGFTDEISGQFDLQLQRAGEWGLSYLEIRGVNGKNISALTLEEIKEVKRKLLQAGIQVSALGSPIGKVDIREPFEPHFALFQHMVECAGLLETPYIRLFSFYMPDGEEPDQYEEEVVRRLSRMIAYAKEHGVILLHENEKKIFGDTAARCSRLFGRLYGEYFQAVFDFANFIECGEDTVNAYELLKPYIAYLHIKDAVAGEKKIVPAGEGSGRIKEILLRMKEDGYAGFLSLEPHLNEFTGLKELEASHQERHSVMSAETAWRYALLSLKGILWDIDWKRGVGEL